MNSTSTRVTKYVGIAVAGFATSIMLAAPANAMRPDPAPSDSGAQVAAPGSTTPVTTSSSSSSDGIDWTAVASGIAGGVALTGGTVLVAAQSRRRRGATA